MSLQFGDPTNKRNAIRSIQIVLIVLLITSAFLAITAFSASKDEAVSHDGLEKIIVKGIDLAYARPGATLTKYDKVMIDPIEVTFHKDWDLKKMGSAFMLTTTERETIRKNVAKIVYEELSKELQAKSTYQVVDMAGPTVLRVRPIVANLYVNAIDTMSTGRSGAVTAVPGEMTLIEELYDSESGAVLARVVDRSVALDATMITVSSGVFNITEARTIASEWARTLRSGLDRAHGIGEQ